MDYELNVDFLNANGAAEGEVAAYLLTQRRLDAGAMRPFLSQDGRKAFVTVFKGKSEDDLKNPKAYQNIRVPINAGTLRRDEWKSLDMAVLDIARKRLRGIQDLIDNGLTYNLGNAMGTTVLEYHNISDAFEAELTMDGITRTQGDRPVYDTVYMPIPIIHVDFEINARVLAASRNMGNPLDTTSAEKAARKVAEKLEDMLFTATTYTYGGGTIYSYLNQPNRNTVTLSSNWDASAKTGAQILADVQSMIAASINAKHYGPWMLYIPTAYQTVLNDDYATGYPKSIRQRLLELEGIKGIKVVDHLTANNVLLVEMSREVVRLVRGMDIQVVRWAAEGNMVEKFKVMAIQVPQVRADQEGNSGLVHLA